MKLSKEVLAEYSKSRGDTYKSIVCHAPFVSLNFEQNGNVRACCYNFTHILGTWPKNSIKEIWKSAASDKLRHYIRENELGGGCSECGSMIEMGNHNGVRARFYDEYAPSGLFSTASYLKNKITGYIGYPKVMEFELSNKCNLECVMCNGYFSSSIRKNREQLPALENPYNDDFVNELDEFIPHLTDAKFLGGEPFMIDIYMKIWERIRMLNPNMRIHITTNGTFLTDRVKNLLEGLRAGIIISIDSVNRDTYNKIRTNGSFDKVMSNLEYFRDYTKKKNTFISVAACPITYNWQELPEMLGFCLEKDITLYFNAVFTPEELSLREQPLETQEKIIAYLKSYNCPEIKGNLRSPRNLSIKAYSDFIKQLEGWIKERRDLLLHKEIKVSQIKYEHAMTTDGIFKQWSEKSIYEYIVNLVEIEKTGYFEKEKETQIQLIKQLVAADKEQLPAALFQFVKAYEDYYGGNNLNELGSKISEIGKLIYESNYRERILSQMALAPPFVIAKVFIDKTFDELKKEMNLFKG